VRSTPAAIDVLVDEHLAAGSSSLVMTYPNYK